MTPDLLEHYRERLLQMEEDLAAADALGHDSQRIVELDQQSVGRLARMDALQNQAMAQANGRMRETQGRRIFAALSRIVEGTYGKCVDCGEEIPSRRLDLDPTHALCVSCASG